MLKKTILVCSIVFLLGSGIGLFSAGKKEISENFIHLDGKNIRFRPTSVRQLKTIFNENDFSILSYEERFNIYTEREKELYLFKALFKGGGEGSLLQNHTFGVITGTIMDIAAVGIISVGVTILSIPIILFPLLLFDNTGIENYFKEGLIVTAIGTGGLVLSRLTQFTTVIIYKNSFNTALRKGLGLEKDLSDAFAVENIAFYPIIQPEISQTFGFSQIKTQYGIGCKIQI